MMAQEISPRRKALLILAGVAVLGCVLILLPIAILFLQQRYTAARSAELLASYRTVIARRPQLEARLSELRSRESAAAGLVSGANDALAAANIQTIVKPLVESDGGKIRSVQNMPGAASSSFESVGIQYDMSVPMGRLHDVTYRLETGVPYLFLDDVDIRMPESWQVEGSAANAPDLEIRWTVRAYRWKAAR